MVQPGLGSRELVVANLSPRISRQGLVAKIISRRGDWSPGELVAGVNIFCVCASQAAKSAIKSRK